MRQHLSVVAAAGLVLGALLVAPATPALGATTVALDGFTRTLTGGLGAADTGGAWTLSGAASRFGVASGAATLSTPAGTQLSAYLDGVSVGEVDASARLSLATLPQGNSSYQGLVVRRTASSEYTGRIVVAPSGTVSIGLLAGATNLRTAVLGGLTAAAGGPLSLRVQATGFAPTILRARAWRTGTAEPATWQVTAVDATAGLQRAGAIGLRTYLSSAATNAPMLGSFDDLVVSDPTTTPPPPPPSPPPPPPQPPTAAWVAQDGFARSVANGLGAADVGGAWTPVGTASRFQVSSGSARLSTSASQELSAYLSGATARDTDAAATLSFPVLPVGGTAYAGLVVRRTSTTGYSGRILVSPAGGVTVNVMAGTTSLRSSTVTGLTYAAGTPLRIRVQAVGAGPTTVRARVWRAGDTEPTAWQVSAPDSSAALQSAGAVGLRTYAGSAMTNAPLVATFDDLVVGAPPSVPNGPTAAFTAATDGLAVTLDGTGSTGAAGLPAAYAWDFGDGRTASGLTATHVYAAAGTYAVKLTVTDVDGASGVLTRSVAVSAPVPGRPTQAQWLADVVTAVAGATDYVAGQAAVTQPAIVLDIDNTALQSYYQLGSATPPVLAVSQRAVEEGYRVLVATGRAADGGGTLNQLTSAGYRVDGLCFRDPAAASIRASKIACRAGWAAQGFTIVANVGNNTTDLAGANAGKTYLLPNYGFLD